jgi:DNA primase
MKSNSLSFTEANNISIVDYLSRLGFEPTRIRGIDYWYYSPFREERTPSFKVNIHRNVWYDHGMGEGGGILNLGAKLNQCTLSEFLEKLALGHHGISIQRQAQLPVKPEARLEILSINNITSVNLIHYLHGRGIDAETAKQYCKEIEFRIGPKMYDAIGFPNRSGAYELHNCWFKGSSALKDISHNQKQLINARRDGRLHGFSFNTENQR